MKPRLHLVPLLLVLGSLVLGSLAPAQQPTVTSTTTLVLVPTLVQSTSGELAPVLTARDFRLTDNGVEQQLTLENTARQPLSVVILMQTGASAPRQFASYRNLAPMVEALMGTSPFHVALVTFDSQPEEIWDFSPSIDPLTDAFTRPTPGDPGAAILDALNFGIDLLERQPPTSRRILLLLSQPQDLGSKSAPADIVRRLGASNTTIETLTFSPEKAWLKDQFTGPRHGQKPYQLGPLGPTLIGTFDLYAPLSNALRAMETDTPAEIATLSGGEHLRFTTRADLELDLRTLANHIPNAFTLSFHPTSPEPGFHTLHVDLRHPAANLHLTTRTGYWSTELP